MVGGGIIDARGAYIPVIRPCDVVGVNPTMPTIADGTSVNILLWYSFNRKTRIKEGRCADTSGVVNGAVILHDVELFSPSELGQQLNCFIHAEGCKPQWMP